MLSIGCRHSNGSFAGRRYRSRHGCAVDEQIKGRVSRENSKELQRDTVADDVGRGGGALQRGPGSRQIDGEHGRNLLHGQSSSSSRLHARFEAFHANVWRREPPDIRLHGRYHHLPTIPRSAEHRSEEAAGQLGTISGPPFLRARLRSSHQ